MNEMQSTGCFSPVSQTAVTTSENTSFQLFHTQNMFPGTSSQQGSAFLSTTTSPVWSYAPPRTHTRGSSNNQEFVSTNPSSFPPIVTATTSTSSNPNSVFGFSAPKPVNSPDKNDPRASKGLRFPLTMQRKETFRNSPSTATSSMLTFSPGPTLTVPQQFSFTSTTTSASNIFSNVSSFTFPDTKAFKFSSYPPEKKNTFNWSPSTSSQSMNENVFASRGSFFNAGSPRENFNSSGPTLTVPKQFSFTSTTTSASNIFSNVSSFTLPDTKAFKFSSYPPEKKNTFNWSPSTSSLTTNENAFGSRGSFFNAGSPRENFNSSGPTLTVPKQFSFTSTTTSTSNIFSNVSSFTLPDTKAFKFSSYPPEKKNTFNWSPSTSSQTTNENVFVSRGSFFDAGSPRENFNSSGPTLTVPKQFSFTSTTTSASNIFSNVSSFTLPDTKAFKFSSYPPEKKNTFNWSPSTSSQTTNENVFVSRGSFFDAGSPRENFNSSGQLSSHFNKSQHMKFIPTPVRDIYLGYCGRMQSITAMAEYLLMSFEEIRFEYYKAQQKKSAFGSSPFSFNAPYFFSGGNKESKQMVHKETQTSSDPDRQQVYPKRFFNELWKVLECIVCLDTVKTPIMQCESGHHLCNQCWSKVSFCPMCKRKKTSVRNFALETVFEMVPLPCKYHNEGCETMVMAEEKEEHENVCEFRPFSCPIQSCKQELDPKDFMVHCVSIHEIRIAVECPLDNSSYVWNSYILEPTKYICAFNLLDWGIFLLCHKEVEETSCFWLQLLHVDSKDATFIYEIKLSDKKTMESAIYRGPVTRLSFNTKEVKHKCLRMSSLRVSAMKSATYQMKLEIWNNNFTTT